MLPSTAEAEAQDSAPAAVFAPPEAEQPVDKRQKDHCYHPEAGILTETKLVTQALKEKQTLEQQLRLDRRERHNTLLSMSTTHDKAQAELDDSQDEIQEHNTDVEQQACSLACCKMCSLTIVQACSLAMHSPAAMHVLT